MMHRCLIIVSLSLCAVSVGLDEARASCINAVSSITLLENAPPVHLTAVNQACVALAPSELSVVNGPGSNGCPANWIGMAGASPAPSHVAFSTDATGINAQAVPSATGMASCQVGVVFKDGGITNTSWLNLTLSSGVTATSLTSP